MQGEEVRITEVSHQYWHTTLIVSIFSIAQAHTAYFGRLILSLIDSIFYPKNSLIVGALKSGLFFSLRNSFAREYVVMLT